MVVLVAGASFVRAAAAGRGAADEDFAVAPADYADVFRAAISDRTVRERELRGARLRIYGPLEARLQSVDRVVVAREKRPHAISEVRQRKEGRRRRRRQATTKFTILPGTTLSWRTVAPVNSSAIRGSARAAAS